MQRFRRLTLRYERSYERSALLIVKPFAVHNARVVFAGQAIGLTLVACEFTLEKHAPCRVFERVECDAKLGGDVFCRLLFANIFWHRQTVVRLLNENARAA